MAHNFIVIYNNVSIRISKRHKEPYLINKKFKKKSINQRNLKLFTVEYIILFSIGY